MTIYLEAGYLNNLARPLAKRLCVTFPNMANSIWRWYYTNFRYKGEKERGADASRGVKNRAKVFESIFDQNKWENAESISGFGSTLYNTTIIRKELPKVVKKFDVKSILDAPCGDFNWMQYTKLPEGVEYIGCDIVPALVASLNERYSNNGRRFEFLDIVEGPIPKADLWLCRDALFHLSFRDGISCLENAAKSDIKYFFATSHDYVDVNVDIETGAFRFIDLCKPPYLLPPPIYKFEDYLAPNAPRILGLWDKSQLEQRFR